MSSSTIHNIAAGILARRQDIVDLMQRHLGCGPFDGGCVVFSKALQAAFGGDIYVIEGRWHIPGSRRRRVGESEWMPALQAHHSILRLPQQSSQEAADALYADADGVREGRGVLDMFIQVDGLSGGFSDLSLRPFSDRDLPDCERSPDLVDAIALLLREASPAGALISRGVPAQPTRADFQATSFSGGLS